MSAWEFSPVVIALKHWVIKWWLLSSNAFYTACGFPSQMRTAMLAVSTSFVALVIMYRQIILECCSLIPIYTWKSWSSKHIWKPVGEMLSFAGPVRQTWGVLIFSLSEKQIIVWYKLVFLAHSVFDYIFIPPLLNFSEIITAFSKSMMACADNSSTL